MKGNQQVIDALNAGLTIELTAINQYFCQAKMCKNWGYARLAKKHHEESIEEMKHADALIERILFLEGIPNIAKYDVIRVGSDVAEQFDSAVREATAAFGRGECFVEQFLDRPRHVEAQVMADSLGQVVVLLHLFAEMDADEAADVAVAHQHDGMAVREDGFETGCDALTEGVQPREGGRAAPAIAQRDAAGLLEQVEAAISASAGNGRPIAARTPSGGRPTIPARCHAAKTPSGTSA